MRASFLSVIRFLRKASCPSFWAGCFLLRGHTSIHSKSSSLCLLKKQAYSPGKIFPLSFPFYKASPLSLLPPCLKQPIKYAAFSINSRSLSCFHVFPSSPVWNPFSCSLCFSKKQSSFASCFVFFLSPLQLSFENKKERTNVARSFDFLFTAKRFRQNTPIQCQTPQRH